MARRRKTGVHTGNREFIAVTGSLRAPRGCGGRRSQSAGGSDMREADEFVFQITQDEFLEAHVEDLPCPTWVRTPPAARHS